MWIQVNDAITMANRPHSGIKYTVRSSVTIATCRIYKPDAHWSTKQCKANDPEIRKTVADLQVLMWGLELSQQQYLPRQHSQIWGTRRNWTHSFTRLPITFNHNILVANLLSINRKGSTTQKEADIGEKLAKGWWSVGDHSMIGDDRFVIGWRSLGNRLTSGRGLVRCRFVTSLWLVGIWLQSSQGSVPLERIYLPLLP